MSENIKNPFWSADRIVIIIYVVLLVFGWISICGASHEIGDTDFFSWDTRTGKQLVWIGAAFLLGFVLLMLDDKYLDVLSELFYWGMMIVLLITPFIAKDIKGSRSWISFGAFNLQPAEFAKWATALALAKLMGRYGFSMANRRDFARAVGMVLLPMVLIVLQRETGSALVYLAFFLMFYREGMPGSILFVAVAAVIYFVVGIRFAETPMPFAPMASVGEYAVLLLIEVFVIGMLRVYTSANALTVRLILITLACSVVPLAVSAWIVPFDVVWVLILLVCATAFYLAWLSLRDRVSNYIYIALFALGSAAFLYASDYVLNHVLEDHQRTRIQVLLGMNDDTRAAGYNVHQSKIAIGSGGLEGKGFMNGTQTKLRYVPEQDTDFIFCTVGEEEGFIGSAAVLLLFLALILRLIYLAERQSTVFGRVYGYCVMSILLFHVFINVGMVMGLTPVIGIPLPFFSYGGSSLWGFTLLLFTFLRIDAGRKRPLV